MQLPYSDVLDIAHFSRLFDKISSNGVKEAKQWNTELIIKC